MSGTKQWAMSPAGIAEATRLVEEAERQWRAVCASCALAARHVDAATLDDITYHAARELGQAYDVLAMAEGYDGAYDMVSARPGPAAESAPAREPADVA